MCLCVLSTFDRILFPLARSLNLKDYLKKIVDPMVHLHIFTEMGDVMYLRKVGIHIGAHLINRN
jgi:hypothetical protein